MHAFGGTLSRWTTLLVLREYCSCLAGRDSAHRRHAQSYANKPIRVVVAIAARQPSTDVIMRAAANELSPRLGSSL